MAVHWGCRNGRNRESLDAVCRTLSSWRVLICLRRTLQSPSFSLPLLQLLQLLVAKTESETETQRRLISVSTGRTQLMVLLLTIAFSTETVVVKGQ